MFIVPRIGSYSLEAIDIVSIKEFNPDLVLVLDYGLSVQDIERLEAIVEVDVAVVDHHKNALRSKLFCNPLAYGLSEDDWSSTTWLLKTLLSMKYMYTHIDDLVVLGILGDLGPRIDVSKWRYTVDRLASIHGYQLSLLMRIVDIVDSCYRLSDYQCIDYVRKILAYGNLYELLNNHRVVYTWSCIDREMKNILSSVERVSIENCIYVFRVDSYAYLTSYIGRALAREYSNGVVVLINYVKSFDQSYIYVRSNRYNLAEVLVKLKSLGIDVGGKDMVFVVTCRSRECSYELEQVLKLLRDVVRC